MTYNCYLYLLRTKSALKDPTTPVKDKKTVTVTSPGKEEPRKPKPLEEEQKEASVAPPPPPPAPQEKLLNTMIPPTIQEIQESNMELMHQQHQFQQQKHYQQPPQSHQSPQPQPMMPLSRGYCSTLTLPTRRPYGKLQDCSDYCDLGGNSTMPLNGNGNVNNNGYMSDGEMVRNSSLRNDMADGYMSEGGNALYQRRLQTLPMQHVPHR